MDDHHEVSASSVPHQVTRPKGHTQPTIDLTPDRLASAIVHYCRDGGRLVRQYHPGRLARSLVV
jgi:hypothetical protein